MTYVIFGPSELATQADNIDKLSGTDDFTTYRLGVPHPV